MVSKSNFFEFRVNYVHVTTAFGGVFLDNVFQMDFICNLNYLISEGVYPVKLYESPRFNRTVLLLDVPNHSYIEVHPADWSHELRGCFAVGRFKDSFGDSSKRLSQRFAASNSNLWLDSLIESFKVSDIDSIKVVYSECIKVYLTGRY